MEQINESIKNLKEKLQGWLDTVIVMLPNLLMALFVLVVGWLLTKFIQRWVEKIIRRFSNHESVVRLGTNVFTVIFVMLIIFLALTILDLDKMLTSLLAGAGVLGLAIGLALQDPLVNLFSGVMMSTKSNYQIGDWVESNGYTGRITEISLRSTIIRTPQGENVLLPNKDIYHNPMKNYTTSGERRVEIACGVSYGDDLKMVRQTAIDAIKKQLTYNDKRDVELFFTDFGDSSINFILRFWLENPTWLSYVAARSEAIIALKQAFDDKDIMIPFPIRTLDFGIRGGEPLDEVLGRQGKGEEEIMTPAE